MVRGGILGKGPGDWKVHIVNGEVGGLCFENVLRVII